MNLSMPWPNILNRIYISKRMTKTTSTVILFHSGLNDDTIITIKLATVSAMIFTWIRNGKPDVSMSLNGSLAGLVAVTAGCANVDVIGSFIIGAVAGVLVCVAVYFIEDKLKVDDPVGAVAVHGCNGIWGTIAVAIFSDKFSFLAQIKGIFVIGIFVFISSYVVIYVINKIFNLRATDDEQLEGLDVVECGIEAYPEFRQTI